MDVLHKFLNKLRKMFGDIYFEKLNRCYDGNLEIINFGNFKNILGRIRKIFTKILERTQWNKV